MTTTTIWRARCGHHDRRVLLGYAGATETHDPFLPACTACDAKWQRWEVTEDRLWRVMDGADLSHFFETKALAEEAMGKAEVAIRGELTGPVRVVRRTLKKVRG